MTLHNFLVKAKSKIATTLNLPILYARNSYAQEGEDIIISKLFSDTKNGFFVDIGAHHPFRYSNTFTLYSTGWTGINIEPTPRAKNDFMNTRPKDTFVQSAVASTEGEKTLYIFAEGALNTLSKAHAGKAQKSGQSTVKKKITVRIQRLSTILDIFAKGKEINFLNIDVESSELDVLKSNNWSRYKPQIIAIECIGSCKQIDSYLSKLGYKKVARTTLTAIYKLK